MFKKFLIISSFLLYINFIKTDLVLTRYGLDHSNKRPIMQEDQANRIRQVYQTIFHPNLTYAESDQDNCYNDKCMCSVITSSSCCIAFGPYPAFITTALCWSLDELVKN